MARSSNSTLSKVAIWIATYAFVLNTILASALISSVPAQALAGTDAFCGSMQAPSPLDQGNGKSAVQHPVCAICASTCCEPLVPDFSLFRIERADVVMLLRSDTAPIAPSDERHTPRLSQGPPANV